MINEKNSLIPRREPAKADPDGVQLIFFLFIVVISERKMEFQFWGGNSPKKFGQKPLLCGWWVVDGRWSKSSFNFPQIKIC